MCVCVCVCRVPTVTSHALVQQPVEQGATVVTEGGAGIGVDLKLVLGPRVLREPRRDRQEEPRSGVRESAGTVQR